MCPSGLRPPRPFTCLRFPSSGPADRSGKYSCRRVLALFPDSGSAGNWPVRSISISHVRREYNTEANGLAGAAVRCVRAPASGLNRSGGIWRFPGRYHRLRQEHGTEEFKWRFSLISCKFVLEKGDLHIPVFDNFLRLECRKSLGYRAS